MEFRTQTQKRELNRGLKSLAPYMLLSYNLPTFNVILEKDRGFSP